MLLLIPEFENCVLHYSENYLGFYCHHNTKIKPTVIIDTIIDTDTDIDTAYIY